MRHFKLSFTSECLSYTLVLKLPSKKTNLHNSIEWFNFCIIFGVFFFQIACLCISFESLLLIYWPIFLWIFCIPSFIFFLHISITLSKVHQLKIKIHFFFCFQKHTKKKQITSMFWMNAEHTSGFRQLVYVYNATVPVYFHTYMTLRKKFDERVLPSAYRFYHISIHFLFVFFCLDLKFISILCAMKISSIPIIPGVRHLYVKRR